MPLKKRLLILSGIVLTIGLFFWMREVASWRPQVVGTWHNAELLSQASGGPYLVNDFKKIRNLDTGFETPLPSTFTEMASFFDPTNPPLIFAPDGQSYAYLQSHPLALKWCDGKTGQVLKSFDLAEDELFVNCLNFRFSSDGSSLIVLRNASLKIFPLDGAKAKTFAIPKAHVALKQSEYGDQAPSDNFFLSPNGRWLLWSPYELFLPTGRPGTKGSTKGATKRKQPQMVMYEVRKQGLVAKLSLPEGEFGTDFSPDATLIDGGGMVDTLDRFNNKSSIEEDVISLPTKKLLWKFDLLRDYDFGNPNYQIPRVTFSPDSHLAVTQATLDSFDVREAHTGRILKHLQLPANVSQVAFSADSRYLYYLSDAFTLWKLRVR